jgi:tetratricopeptide (TPR) repeat protein
VTIVSEIRVGAFGRRFLPIALGVVLFLTALGFGGVRLWASASFELALWSLALASLLSSGGGSKVPRSVLIAASVLLAYLGLQIIPLPPAVHARLSPAAATTRQVSEEALVAEPSPQDPADEVASSPAIERIRDLATERGGYFRAWRPIALYPFGAATDVLRYLAYLTAFYLAATLPAPALIVRGSVISGCAVAALAIAQFSAWNGHLLWLFDPYDRKTLGDHPLFCGPFVNPSHFSLFVAMTLAPGVAWAVESWRRLRRRYRRFPELLSSALLPGLLVSTAFAVMIAGIVGSASRGALIATPVAMGMVWWGSRTPRAAKLRGSAVRRPLDGAVPLIAAAAIIVAGLAFAGTRAREAVDVRLNESITTPDFRIRLDLWSQTLPMLRDYAWFGTGPAGWAEAFPRYLKYPLAKYAHNHAHNDYLEWATEVGWVGVFVTLALLASLGRWAIGNASLPRTMRWGIAAGLVAAACEEVFDFGLRVPANALLVSMLGGSLCNPYWNPSVSVAEDEPTSRAVGRPVFAVAACVVFALLVLASTWQLREFLQWRSVRDGSLNLAFAPRDAATWEELGARLVAQGEGLKPLAARCFQAAHRLRPARGEPVWRLSQIATNKAESLEGMAAALELEPTRTEWRLAYASALDLEGRSVQAVAELEEAAYRDPRWTRHRYLDELPARLLPSFLPPAERGFRRAVDDRPDDPVLLDEVASFYFRFGAWLPAAALWERAAERSRDWAHLGRYAARAFARAGDFSRAEEILRRGIRQRSTEAEIYRVLAMSVYAAQKKYPEAEQTLELGASRALDPSWIYLDLSAVEAEQGKRDEARRALETAGNGNPRDAALQLAVGKAYLAVGENEQARHALELGLEADPRRAELHHQKGVALERLYDLDGAHAEYQRAHELEPENDVYRENFERIDHEFHFAQARTDSVRSATR